jgi:hypothetical protein
MVCKVKMILRSYINIPKIKNYEAFKPPHRDFVGGPCSPIMNVDGINQLFVTRNSLRVFTMDKGIKYGPYSLNDASKAQIP